MIDVALLDFLVPSWWEIEVTVAASVFVIFAYWFFAYRGGGDGDGDRLVTDNSAASGIAIDDKAKVNSSRYNHFSGIVLFFLSFF